MVNMGGEWILMVALADPSPAKFDPVQVYTPSSLMLIDEKLEKKKILWRAVINKIYKFVSSTW